MTDQAPPKNEYQPRTQERLIELLRSFEYGPRSWQSEAADMIERLNAVILAHIENENKLYGEIRSLRAAQHDKPRRAE